MGVPFPASSVWQEGDLLPGAHIQQQQQQQGSKGKGHREEKGEEEGLQQGEEAGSCRHMQQQGAVQGKGEEKGEDRKGERRKGQVELDRGWLLAPVLGLGEGPGFGVDWKLVDDSIKLFPLRNFSMGANAGKGEEEVTEEGLQVSGSLLKFRPVGSNKTKVFRGVKELNLTVGQMREIVGKRSGDVAVEGGGKTGSEKREGEVSAEELRRLSMAEVDGGVWKMCRQDSSVWLVEALRDSSTVFREVLGSGRPGIGERVTRDTAYSISAASAKMKDKSQSTEGIEMMEDAGRGRLDRQEKYSLLCGELCVHTGLRAGLFEGWQVGMAEAWSVERKLKVASLVQRASVPLRTGGRLLHKALMKPEYERMEAIGDAYLKVRRAWRSWAVGLIMNVCTYVWKLRRELCVYTSVCIHECVCTCVYIFECLWGSGKGKRQDIGRHAY